MQIVDRLMRSAYSRMTLIRFVCLAFLLSLVGASFGQGGPPLITDDPGTPGNKHWEINVAYTRTNLDIGRIQELPHIDLNYGYGDNVQLKLEGPFTLFDGSGVNYTGLGYTNWGVKWRFLEENKTRPAVSTYPQILFVGSQEFARLGVVDPGTDLYLPIEVMKTFGKLLLDADGGPLFREFTGTQISSGICGEYDLTPHLALLGEVHYIGSTALVQDQLVWNLGFKQDLSEHESILFSAGRSFGPQGGDEPGLLIYVGMQFRF